MPSRPPRRTRTFVVKLAPLVAVGLVAAALPVTAAAEPASAAPPALGSPRAAVPAAWSTSGPSPAFVTAVGWNATVPGTVYAGTSNGVVLRSTDAGATWSSLGAVADDSVADIAARGNTVLVALQTFDGGVGGVARSLDGGATWQLAGPAQGISNAFSYEVDISPTSPDTALLGTNGGLFRTTNAGGTWSPVAVPGGSQIFDVLFDPTQPNVAFAAGNGEVARSTNSGASFTAFAGGVSSASSSNLSRIGSFLYAAGFSKVIRTDPASAGWASAATGLPISGAFPGRVVGSGTNLFLPLGGTVFVTPAAAISWATAPVQPPVPVSALEVDPAAPARILGLGAGAMVRTTDGGATWQPVSLTIPAARTTAVAPTVAGSVLVNAEPGLVRSDDHGRTFALSSTGLSSSPPLDYPGAVVAPGDPSRALVFAGSGQLSLSTDGGRTWAPRTYGTSNFDGVLAFAPSDPSRVYGAGFVGATGLVRRSTNGGDSWAPANSAGALFDFAEGLAVDVSDPLRVYLSTSDGLRVSPDGGDTWALGGTGLQAGGTGRVVAHPTTPGTACVVAANKLWRSTDRGASWTPLTVLPSGSPTDVVVDPATPTTLFAATDTGVFRSQDSGTSWEPYSTGLPSPLVHDLAIDRDGSVLYAATDRGLAVTALVLPPVVEPPTTPPPTGPTAVPSRPTKVAAKVKRGKVILTWRAPTSGAPLTTYTVQAKLKNKKKASFRTLSAKVKPSATKFVWRKAKKGRTYLLRLAAANALGRGPFSRAASVRVPRP